MGRNVEIKASVKDVDAILKKAQEISGQSATLIPQNDTFFQSKEGRLKLREFPGDDQAVAELIHYNRPETAGPKISDYVKVPVSEPKLLKKALTNSNGIIGTVNKVRHLFLVGQTRIHVDKVEGLGNFMELEVCLTEDQTLEDGQTIAEDFMEKLGISHKSLVQGAYLDAILDN